MTPRDDDPTLSGRDPRDSGSGFREPGIPPRIGRYSLRRRIASGGMGTVYEAIQDEPRRPVALKVMRGEIAGPDALRRFQIEAQILGRLRHPAIAQVYEAGTHDDGSGPVPFFAMEYIPNAKTIVEYADSHRLGLRERLSLFARVCDAVHHGHQKGILHRDLKPGNILVDSAGDPHVIDFGVARATDGDLALATVQTEVGQLVGSIAYMSPEQFAADPNDLDTRSDVYALGVVLYELLGGKLPYDVLKTSIFDAARVIREAPPRRLGDLRPDLRGEVETIVHKALEKERDRRYQSAYGLAEDVRRYLAGQAIAARPASLGYHFRVFARRNKLLIGALGAVFLALAGGLAASTVLYVRAEHARDRAARESVRSQAAIDFITSALESVTPVSFDTEPTLDDLIQGLASKVDGAFPDDPAAEAEIRLTIARGLTSLTDIHPEKWSDVEDQVTKALALRDRAFGPASDKTLEVRDFLARMDKVRGRTEDEAAMRRSIFDALRTSAGDNDPRTLAAASALVEPLGLIPRYAEAETLAAWTLARQLKVLGPDDQNTLTSRSQLAWLEIMRGRGEAAETEAASLLASCRRLFGDDDRLTKTARSELAAALIIQGKLDEAKDIYGSRQVPNDLEPVLTYQGNPSPPRTGTQLFVYWETWCPFSQRTVPSLEDVHLRHRAVDVVGLTGARPPSTDDKVSAFLTSRNVTYPVLKVGRATALALDVPGTPWLVLSREGWILWESDMDAPAALVSSLLDGIARGRVS